MPLPRLRHLFLASSDHPPQPLCSYPDHVPFAAATLPLLHSLDGVSLGRKADTPARPRTSVDHGLRSGSEHAGRTVAGCKPGTTAAAAAAALAGLGVRGASRLQAAALHRRAVEQHSRDAGLEWATAFDGAVRHGLANLARDLAERTAVRDMLVSSACDVSLDVGSLVPGLTPVFAFFIFIIANAAAIFATTHLISSPLPLFSLSFHPRPNPHCTPPTLVNRLISCKPWMRAWRQAGSTFM